MMTDRSTDQAAISRILHAYTAGIDRGDFRAVADLFEDGSWNSRAGSQEAFDYLTRNMILYSGTPETAHILSDVVIEIGDNDTATARSHCTVWQKPPEAALRSIAVMHYDDRFWKPRGQWAFRHRCATMLLAGDLSAHLRLPPPAPTGPRSVGG